MKGRTAKPIVIAMAVWLTLLGAFLSWLVVDSQRHDTQAARITANAVFQQILISRQWNAAHGGIYVPITASTPPNPYLPLANRDLTATNGTKLTKLNPSYMTRQLAELASQNQNDIQFHATSLQPIRPENKPLAWEARWLKSFEQGVKEQGAFFQEGTSTWFRYMAPLTTEAACLQCHAQQGYQLGDIRGGLSVSLPYPTHNYVTLLTGFGAVAAIGLLVIFVGGTFYERKRLLFDAIFDNTTPTCVADSNYTILMANESYWTEFGPLPKGKKSIKCHEHRPGPSCHTDRCPLTHIMNGEQKFVCEASKEKGGVSQHFIVTAKPLLDSRGKLIVIVESFQVITERKQAEKALEESNRKLEALSMTDGLTGIANRRYFDEVLAQEYARHARSGAELSLILLDIDLFKAFNDYYGHVNGDDCLRQVARVIANCAVRPADLAARYGGEEFACILPETDRNGAIAIAEKIRQGISARAIPHHGSDVADHVTASLGVVTVQCTPDGSAVGIITQADALLYRAKASGRNRVEFAGTRAMAVGISRNLVQLAWKDSFCCGNRMIDAQHQTLFHRANELLAAILSARPATEVATIIAKLLADIGHHFQDEEKLLHAIAYPEVSQHAAKHAKLLAKAHELSREFNAATLSVGDVFEFLVQEVVLLHMLKVDQEYIPFLSAAEPEPDGPPA